MSEVPKHYGLTPAEDTKPQPPFPYEEQRQKLKAIAERLAARRIEAQAEVQQAAERDERSTSTPADASMPTASEVARRRADQIPAEVVEEQKAKQGADGNGEFPVTLTSGEVLHVAEPWSHPDFVMERRPELVEYVDNRKTFELLTGVWLTSWRQRTPADGDAKIVIAPARPQPVTTGDRSVRSTTYAQWRADVYARGADTESHLRGKASPYTPTSFSERNSRFSGWSR